MNPVIAALLVIYYVIAGATAALNAEPWVACLCGAFAGFFLHAGATAPLHRQSEDLLRRSIALNLEAIAELRRFA
jgi:hypothetical protein